MKWENQKNNNFERFFQELKFGHVNFEMLISHFSRTANCDLGICAQSESRVVQAEGEVEELLAPASRGVDETIQGENITGKENKTQGWGTLITPAFSGLVGRNPEEMVSQQPREKSKHFKKERTIRDFGSSER